MYEDIINNLTDAEKDYLFRYENSIYGIIIKEFEQVKQKGNENKI